MFYPLFFEGMGSAVIILTLNFVPGNIPIHNVSLGLVHQMVAMATTYCLIIFGEISGGHYNPALTIGMLFLYDENPISFTEKLGKRAKFKSHLKLAIGRIQSQIIGGFIGALLALTGLPYSQYQRQQYIVNDFDG